MTTMAKRAVGRTSPELGAFVRNVIKQKKGRTQREVAEGAGIRNAQLSNLVNGENVEIQWYERIARETGYRNALAMFTSGGDALTRNLLQLWKALPDDAARKDALKAVREIFDATQE